MISIEEVEEMLDEIAESLPEEFYYKLNGGILLLPQAETHPKGNKKDIYVLGQYHYSSSMGRYIAIYYGSFMEVYGDLSKEKLYEELKKTLIHEFTHHIESLAGDRSLADKCEMKLRRYLGS